ncbi:MAG: transporter [Actinomycetia bacterium]|nr:transporter [Actinomycetes bacterium]
MSARITIGGFAGPLAGGMLFAFDPAVPFLADAFTFLLAGLLVALFRKATPAPAARPVRRNVVAELKQGLRWVWERPALRSLAALISAVNFTQAATQSMPALFAVQRLGLGSQGYGILLAASGVGALLAGLAGTRLRRLFGSGRLFAVTVIGTIPVFIAFGLTTARPSPPSCSH